MLPRFARCMRRPQRDRCVASHRSATACGHGESISHGARTQPNTRRRRAVIQMHSLTREPGTAARTRSAQVRRGVARKRSRTPAAFAAQIKSHRRSVSASRPKDSPAVPKERSGPASLVISSARKSLAAEMPLPLFFSIPPALCCLRARWRCGKSLRAALPSTRQMLRVPGRAKAPVSRTQPLRGCERNGRARRLRPRD
jgi:hypothetical protein